MTISRRQAIRHIGTTVTLMPAAGSLLLGPAFAAPPVEPTPFTDIGPFYPVTRPNDEDSDLTMIGRGLRASGDVVEIVGRVLDGKGRPVAGSRIEIWQANASGRYAHAGDTNPRPLDPAFQGFGKVTTDAAGNYRFVTIMPGAYPIPGGVIRPPHIHLDVAGRNQRLITQMLFPGDPLNEKDIVLARVERRLLTATARGKATSGARRFDWDIVLANG